MQLKVKKLANYPKEWALPEYATDGSACFDLCAVIDYEKDKSRYHSMQKTINQQTDTEEILMGVPSGYSVKFSTELAFEIPQDYVMLIFSISGHGFKQNVRLNNCVGIIDSDYRGEVQIALHNDGPYTFVVSHGMRIAQAMLVHCPRLELLVVEELSDTDRGTGGFGSTDA